MAKHATDELPRLSAGADPATLRQLPPTITVTQAAEVLGISRRAAYRAAHTGELPNFRVGSRILVPTARLLELLGLATDHFDDN